MSKKSFPIYATFDKYSRAFPQPFTKDQLALEIMKAEPTFPLKDHKEVMRAIRNWTVNRRKQKAMVAIGKRGNLRFSWDLEDAKERGSSVKRIVSANGAVHVEVDVPPNVISMVVDVYGRKFEIRRVSE